MMTLDVNMQIKLQYNTFSEVQKKLADFILKNPGFIVHQSISEVAGMCGISVATISRFVKTLGYKDYQDFKLAVVQFMPGEEKEVPVSGDIEESHSILDVTRNILARDIEALKETSNLIKEEDIESAVKMMTKAGRIMFFGVGSSLASALEGCNRFVRITPKASINFETHMQYAAAALMSEDDVAIIISYSGSTREIVEIAKTAKGRGAKVICITKYPRSPLTHYSDIILLCSSNERNVHGYALSVEITQTFLLDILYTEFFRQNYDSSQRNKAETVSMFSSKKV